MADPLAYNNFASKFGTPTVASAPPAPVSQPPVSGPTAMVPYADAIKNAGNDPQVIADLNNAYKQAGQLPTATPVATPTPTPTPSPTPTPTPTPTPLEKLQTESDTDAKMRADNLALLDTANQDYQNKITQFEQGIFPLTPDQQAQIDGLKNDYNNLITQQKTANINFTGGTTIAQERRGLSRYAPEMAAANIQKAVTDGISKVSNLESKMASAVGEMKTAFETSNFKLVKEAHDSYVTSVKEKDATIKSMYDEVQAQIKTQKDAIQKTQDDINKVALEAAKNGVPADVMKLIRASGSESAAIEAAGMYLQTATGVLGDYLQYKKDALGKGLTPKDFQSWKDEQDKKASQLKSSEAYSTAYNTALGKAKGEAANNPSPTDDTSINSTLGTGKGGSILDQTGLSFYGFKLLTEGSAALSRFTAAQRKQYGEEVKNWASKNGIDISTFKSQFEAQNKVVEKNIERAAQTKVFAGEVSGTADALMSAIDEKDMGNIRQANLVNLFLGKEVNDPTTQKYSFQLKAMGNDLAGYFAASRGATSPDDSDKKDAAIVIADGMSKGSVQAFKDSINLNEEKVNNVVNSAVDSAQKSVWNLFGVGKNYQAPAIDPQKAVDSYVASHPDKAETIAKMYEVPGATDQDIADYINTLNK